MGTEEDEDMLRIEVGGNGAWPWYRGRGILFVNVVQLD